MRILAALLAATISLGAATMAPASDGARPDEAHLILMEELQVPIVDGGRADGALRVRLVLQMTDAATAADATAKLPTLRAAMLGTALEFSRLYASPMTPVDAGRLTTDMTDALRRTDPGIVRVLIVEVSATRA